MKSIHINWLVFSHRYCVLLTLLLLSVEIKSAPAFDQNTDAAAGQQGQWQPQAEFGQPAQLGQSDWQQPQSSQNQMQQPQNQSGQSDWQQPQSSQNQWQQPQNQPGQSDWQQPQSSQNQWQQPQSQLGQSDWQQPGQNSFSQNNPNDADANSTFYGQAQETQALSPLPANNPNQQFNNSAPANFAQQNSLAQKNAKKENGKNSHTPQNHCRRIRASNGRWCWHSCPFGWSVFNGQSNKPRHALWLWWWLWLPWHLPTDVRRRDGNGHARLSTYDEPLS